MKKEVIKLNGYALDKISINKSYYWHLGTFVNKRIENLYYLRGDAGTYYMVKKRHKFNIKVVDFFFKIIPNQFTLKDAYAHKTKLIVTTNFFRTYRQFMCRPSRGQRTWSNAKTAKRENTLIREWFVDQHQRRFSFKCPRNLMVQTTQLEFFNEM